METRSFASFGGVPALQTWGDFELWELLLNAHPELRGIAELGTWQGGFARYLAAQAEQRGMSFATLDYRVPERPPPGFRLADLFEPTAPTLVRSLLPKPGILLCDAGDKPREVELFAPSLEPGELLVVHDWGDEIGSGDIPWPILKMVHGDLCRLLGAMSRVFVRQ